MYRLVLLGFLALSFATLSHGYPRKDGDTLIVGGVEAAIGEFPWIVDIRRGTGTGSHSCGGSIVNANWVVTAAHCSTGAVSDYILVAGDHVNTVEEGTEQRRGVSKIIVHPSYANPVAYTNDIALMKLSQPFTLNARVQPVTLAPSGFQPPQTLTVAGWGRTTEGGVSSATLLKVDVPFVSDATCRNAYGTTRITDQMICGGTGGKDACQGDSGGPLMCKSGSSSVLCGIVSWGTGCARPTHPGVYTEVSYFPAWVQATIAAN